MTNTFIYNKQSNSIKQKAAMARPVKVVLGSNPDTHKRELEIFDEITKQYNQHIASLKEYPCMSNKWIDKQELILGKDFEIKEDEVQDQDNEGNWLRSCHWEDFASPIHTEVEDEDKLWDELFEKLYHDCDMEALTYTTDTMIEKLKQVFSIKRKRAHNQYWKR